jgi:hypothetical protein
VIVNVGMLPLVRALESFADHKSGMDGTPVRLRLASQNFGAPSGRGLPRLAPSFFSFHRETAPARSHVVLRFLGV